MADNSRDGFNHKVILGFTIVQLVCGSINVVTGVCQIVTLHLFGYYAVGIWCGVMFIVTSILGFTSWKFKNNCNIIALMVLCIVSAVVAFGGCAMEIIICIMLTSSEYSSVSLALHSFLAVVILVDFVIAILCSTFCCKAVCCGPPSPDRLPVYGSTLPNQYQSMYVHAPVAPPTYFVSQNPVLPGDGARYAENTHNSTTEKGF